MSGPYVWSHGDVREGRAAIEVACNHEGRVRLADDLENRIKNIINCIN